MVNHADPVATTSAPTAAHPAGQTARTGITGNDSDTSIPGMSWLIAMPPTQSWQQASTELPLQPPTIVSGPPPPPPGPTRSGRPCSALYVRVGGRRGTARHWFLGIRQLSGPGLSIRSPRLPRRLRVARPAGGCLDGPDPLKRPGIRRNRASACVNAFGERYRHALCPSFPEVRQYAATVVEQVLTLGQPDGIILEAVGPLGFGHQNQHEKTAGADYSTRVQDLLSLCFCTACSESYQERGIDADSMRTAVRDAVRWDEAVAPLTNDNDGRFQLLLEVRWDATAALLDGVLAQIELWKDSAASTDRSGFGVSLHVSPDPWSTGPFVALEALRRSSVDLGRVTAVVPCWESSSQGAQTVALLRSAEPQLTVGSYVLVLPPKTPDAGGFVQNWAALADAGSSELHVYHLGLASSSRLKAVGAAVRTITDGEK